MIARTDTICNKIRHLDEDIEELCQDISVLNEEITIIRDTHAHKKQRLEDTLDIQLKQMGDLLSGAGNLLSQKLCSKKVE